MKGCWVLKGTEPPLYTRKAADIIKHKQTGKEYIRGDFILFDEKKLPDRIENTDEYEFIYIKDKSEMELEDYLREIYVQNLFK